MGTMIRRLVNIVAERGCSGVHTLHRLDVSKHLFYPSRAAAEAASKTNVKVPLLHWLPPSVMRFEPASTTLWDGGRLAMFALVSPRSCDDRILCCNMEGHTMLYHADYNCVQAVPDLKCPKGFMPVAISIARPDAPEEDLYVMNTATCMGSCFEMLTFCGTTGWRWDPLPQPPFAAHICSHTVVGGGSTICVSAASPTSGTATFCYDTIKGEWTQAATGWVLPFHGAAEYVPELKLWMGFSSDSQQLCAWDLSAMDKPPTLQHSWIDLKTPEEWSASRISLLNLGGGRFCIAKTFRVMSGTVEDSIEDKFAVLTGIEMVSSCGDNDPEQGLKMVRHKSIRYMFNNEMIRWVL